MAENIKSKILNASQRNYVSRDYNSLRKDLLDYARTYYPDRIQDFSEAALGGLFLDMAAYVGDSLNFYLDHQFHEMNAAVASETKNIEMHARNLGYKIMGASPAAAIVEFWIEVPAIQDSDGTYRPDTRVLPIIKSGTVLSSELGVKFNLTEDLDYSEINSIGDLVAYNEPIQQTNNSNPETFVLMRTGVCVSGNIKTDTFAIPNTFKKFRKITIPQPNVTSILTVVDTDLNQYYEVDNLSQDTVFRRVRNISGQEVDSNLEVIAAPYRFTSETDINTLSTTIQFGAGNATSLNNDVIPDPSNLALPLFGKNTFSSFAIDPNSLLETKTLGIAPINTTISITYRHGGGASHNVAPKTISTISGLNIKFRDDVSFAESNTVRNSLYVENPDQAYGGSDPQTLAEIRENIKYARNMQARVVTKQDLLARLYTLPSEFGRVYRAAITTNPLNSLASILYLVSRDSSGNLVPAPDALKDNIATYINEYRLVGDAIDILDARIINYRVKVSVIAGIGSNLQDIASKIKSEITSLTDKNNFQIGSPIIESDFINAVINVQGVLALEAIEFENLNGTILDRSYSSSKIDMTVIKEKGMYFADRGDIFEMRFPNHDIEITVQ